MRVTVEIDEEKLQQVLDATGERKKSPAIAKAVDEYLAQRKRQSFADLIRGKGIDYSATNEEIEAAEEARARTLGRGRRQ